MGVLAQIPFLSMVCIHMKTNPYVKIALEQTGDLYFPRQNTQENQKTLEAASGNITLRGFLSPRRKYSGMSPSLEAMGHMYDKLHLYNVS